MTVAFNYLEELQNEIAIDVANMQKAKTVADQLKHGMKAQRNLECLNLYMKRGLCQGWLS